MSIMRLDKYLADMGTGTRSEIKKMAKAGRIKLNDVIEKNTDVKIDTLKDRISVDGNDVVYAEYEYYMLNKPMGVLSATRDKKTPTVLDLIETKKRSDMFPVGRLDKDTEGLLLITNDGQLAHELLSPKKHVSKMYYAKIEGVVTQEHVELFSQGIVLEDGTKTMPADLKILSSGEESLIELTIYEGKFHQVKRMFEAVQTKVTYLKRLTMGPLVLDDALHPGEYREITSQELAQLKADKGD